MLNTSLNGTGASCVADPEAFTRSVATLKKLSGPLVRRAAPPRQQLGRRVTADVVANLVDFLRTGTEPERLEALFVPRQLPSATAKPGKPAPAGRGKGEAVTGTVVTHRQDAADGSFPNLGMNSADGSGTVPTGKEPGRWARARRGPAPASPHRRRLPLPALDRHPRLDVAPALRVPPYTCSNQSGGVNCSGSIIVDDVLNETTVNVSGISALNGTQISGLETALANVADNNVNAPVTVQVGALETSTITTLAGNGITVVPTSVTVCAGSVCV
ncbi:hypothetical protein [Streptomyces sp. NPDC006668]|uniref:hypothetical protein n=1 Tax=Streptomyces sp. NPDC006668 TaxID=3156903 RepID=UPI0033F94E49